MYHCTAHTGAVPLYCTHRCCTTVLHTQVLYHCTARIGEIPLYWTHRCCTTVLHIHGDQVGRREAWRSAFVLFFYVNFFCWVWKEGGTKLMLVIILSVTTEGLINRSTVHHFLEQNLLVQFKLFDSTAHTGSVPLYWTHRCCTTVPHTHVLCHCTAQTGDAPLYCTHSQTPSGPAAPWVSGLETPLRTPPTTILPRLFNTFSSNLGGNSQSIQIPNCNTCQVSFDANILHTSWAHQAPHSKHLYTKKIPHTGDKASLDRCG